MPVGIVSAWFLTASQLLAAAAPPAAAPAGPDALVASPDCFRLLLENEHVRVLEYELQPGESDQWHIHPPKVSYVVTGGRLKITTGDGQSFEVDEQSGSAAWMGSLGLHHAENVGTTSVRIVLIEVKSAADKPAKQP